MSIFLHKKLKKIIKKHYNLFGLFRNIDLYRRAITWNDERVNENDIEYERKLDVNFKNAALTMPDVIASACCKNCVYLSKNLK